MLLRFLVILTTTIGLLCHSDGTANPAVAGSLWTVVACDVPVGISIKLSAVLNFTDSNELTSTITGEPLEYAIPAK